jgi:hypothetical protein
MTTQSNSGTIFACHDLDLAAFLWANGARFLGIEPSPTDKSPTHVVFRFYDPEGQCRKDRIAFDLGAEIPAREYALALKQLKDQIFRHILR